jgi:AcrR family transcriptional regulator
MNSRRGHPGSPRPRGRPSSDSVDRALAKAALEEFVARGYNAMSMESIAARAGVSKVSLYRRWSSKLAVTAEVFRLLSGTTPVEDQGSFEADIRFLLEHSIRSETAKPAAKILMRTMGEISGNPKLLALYRAHLLTPRIEQLRVVIERARVRKELRAEVPADVACAMIAGPLFLYYLTLLTEAEVDLPRDLAAQLTRTILGGIAR